MSEEDYDIEDNYDYETKTSDFTPDDNSAAVMKNFFNLNSYVRNKIAYWQGFTYINGEKRYTHEAIGPDSFIYSIIGLIDAVLSQHNSVSYVGMDGANRILYESIQSLNETVLEEPLFNWSRYSMLLEEFDHMLELFMGLVIKGHGKNVAVALQTGIVAEQQGNSSEKTSMMQTIRDKFD